MSGYVAMARVDAGRVRALAWDAAARSEFVGIAGPAAEEPAAAAAVLQPDDAVTISEQWDRLRDQLSMVTFYLTDPESWR